MKPITELTPKDKMEILFDLFPNEVTPFIAFVLDATVTFRKVSKIKEMMWHDKNYTFKMFKVMVNTVDFDLKKFLESTEQSNSILADILGKGVLSFWTERCLLQYLCLNTNMRFTKAYDLFFNLTSPAFGAVNFYPLLNN